MKKHLSTIVMTILAAATLAVSGCGKRALPPLPKIAKDTQAFDAASAELKAQWTEVLSAAETNGYAVSILGAKKMLKIGDLTDDQRKALTDTQAAMMSALNDAVEKGDANALDDRETVRENWRN
jgi:hypothetical protein